MFGAGKDALARLLDEMQSGSKSIAAKKRVVGLLPQDIQARFKGRTKQQTELMDLLVQDARLVSVYGRGGIGQRRYLGHGGHRHHDHGGKLDT